MANEKRLIDANELLRIYKKWIPQLESPEDAGDKRGVETCIAVLKDAPTVDAAPVVHGRWKRRGRNLGECSECGEIVMVRYPYCPNCGAKMDGGEKNER